MARVHEPTAGQLEAVAQWKAQLPEPARTAMERFNPWTLYKMQSTGHRVLVHGCSDEGTLRVVVSGEYNQVAFERLVFGVDPSDLVECDLPSPDEQVGVTMTDEQQLAYINAQRATHGLPPFASHADLLAFCRGHSDGEEAGHGDRAEP